MATIIVAFFICSNSSLISAYLSGSLWKELTGANVIIQIHKSRNIMGVQEENVVSQMRKSGMEVIISDEKDSICDPALNAALSRVLVLTDQGLADKIDGDDILLVSPDDFFLSRGQAINVLQSDHKIWMFLSEGLFNSGDRWSLPMAATVDTWRQVKSALNHMEKQ